MNEKAAPPHLFADVQARVHAACAALAAEQGWPAGIDLSRVVVEPPRDPSHGDMATNAAMVLAKETRAKPRDLAEQIAARLRAEQPDPGPPCTIRAGTPSGFPQVSQYRRFPSPVSRTPVW